MERQVTRAVTHLWGQVSGGLDSGLDPFHRALVGCADGGGLLCRGAQLVGVVLKVGSPVFKDLRAIRAVTQAAAIKILTNEGSEINFRS